VSWVTDVVLLLNLDEFWFESDENDDEPEEIESESLRLVNEWLQERNHGHLVDLSAHAFNAGNKAMQSAVFGGAFNKLEEEEFIEFVLRQSWVSPSDVQLLVKSESERRFTIFSV